MKKILSLVLALVMALSLTTVAWGAEKTVANATEAQAALDNAAVGTTIRLQSGVNYGTLYIRTVEGGANTTTGHNYFTGNYTNEYLRTVEDVTIVGASGATIDAIKLETNYSSTDGALHLVDIKNLTVDGVTFTDAITTSNYGVFAPILVDLQWARVDGLTVKNCKLTSDQSNDLALVYIVAEQATGSTFETYAKNVTISGNTVDGIRSLCELRETENVTITGNTVSNTTKNSIQMSTNSGKTYSGDVTVTSNTADGIRERFVRMAGADSANVTISNNIITNYRGSDEDYIKVTKADNTNITEQVASNNVLGYTVTFDANGGTGTMASTVQSGAYKLPANGFTAPSGKQFKGWSVNGSEKAVGETITISTDTTVIAVWENVPVYYPVYVPTVEDTTEKDVTSAQTFDAGIALYVGMSVMGAVGTVALSKKRED